MLDLAIEDLPDGAFELRQQDGSLDEPCRILLHRVQVALLAERAGLLPAPAPGLLDRLHARHVGRLHALYDRLAEIRRFHLDGIIDRYADGIEFALHLRALEDLADEMLEDIGTAPPAEPAPECHAVTASNGVTRKPGPKPSGKALTDAERQARHRAKQGELLPIAGTTQASADTAAGA